MGGLRSRSRFTNQPQNLPQTTNLSGWTEESQWEDCVSVVSPANRRESEYVRDLSDREYEAVDAEDLPKIRKILWYDIIRSVIKQFFIGPKKVPIYIPL